MSKESQKEARLWEQERGWDGHRQAQLERMAERPLWEKLQWLEEAHLMVLQLQNRHSDTVAETLEKLDEPGA